MISRMQPHQRPGRSANVSSKSHNTTFATDPPLPIDRTKINHRVEDYVAATEMVVAGHTWGRVTHLVSAASTRSRGSGHARGNSSGGAPRPVRCAVTPYRWEK